MGRETAALTAQVWPNYMVADSDLPEPGLKFAISPDEFARRFPVWGIRHDQTGALVAFLNAVLLHVDLTTVLLPDAGWTFAIQTAGQPSEPNCLCLLAANVSPSGRGAGLSRLLIERAKQATRELGFSTMIAPVRPTLKAGFPFTAMTDYVQRRRENGEIFDPWLNLHIQSGGQIANVCSHSVRVRATLAKWREWTGLPLTTSGDQILPQGLAPLKVDTHRNIGTYIEPGVWLRYSL